MISPNRGQHIGLAPTIESDPDEASLLDLRERETGRSNFTAFVLGGVVIAGGLLGFLYYDTDNLSRRDVLTTGGIGSIEQPATPPSLAAPNDRARTGASAP